MYLAHNQSVEQPFNFGSFAPALEETFQATRRLSFHVVKSGSNPQLRFQVHTKQKCIEVVVAETKFPTHKIPNLELFRRDTTLKDVLDTITEICAEYPVPSLIFATLDDEDATIMILNEVVGYDDPRLSLRATSRIFSNVWIQRRRIT